MEVLSIVLVLLFIVYLAASFVERVGTFFLRSQPSRASPRLKGIGWIGLHVIGFHPIRAVMCNLGIAYLASATINAITADIATFVCALRLLTVNNDITYSDDSRRSRQHTTATI